MRIAERGSPGPVEGHSADPDGHQIQPIADAEGTARDVQSPSDVQAIPSPASPEIATESAERGIALAVNAGLADHRGIGAEESEDAQGTADRPPCDGEARDALESGGEEIAAALADAVANARAPDAADQQGDLTQPEQGPTSTPARRAAEPPKEVESARARSGRRAHLRRGVQRHVDEDRQAPAPAARSPQYPPTLDRDPRMGPSLPIPPPLTRARRHSKDDVAVAPQTRRTGAARGRAMRRIRVGRGSSHRKRRGSGRG
ncbi:unnamed protein product [Closterium sp. Naga37s-1]|nr:unnamed protein product [Closterium sp. Naga37s-1]